MRDEYLNYWKHAPEPSFEITQGQKGAIIGVLNTALGSDAARQNFLGWLVTGEVSPMSTKALDNKTWVFLLSWLDWTSADGKHLISRKAWLDMQEFVTKHSQHKPT